MLPRARLSALAYEALYPQRKITAAAAEHARDQLGCSCHAQITAATGLHPSPNVFMHFAVLKGIDMGRSRGMKPAELAKLVRELCKAHLGGELKVRRSLVRP